MNNTFLLSPWQKKQAALLYYFSSMDYLKGLQKKLDDLMAFIDPTVDLAKVQNRDSVLVDKRWGNRDTVENWANNAWGFLKDFQKSNLLAMAERAVESYGLSGAHFFARALSEFSMQWTTPDEEDQFNRMFEHIQSYARELDRTVDHHWRASKWTDFHFYLAWDELKKQFPQLPKFQIRMDIVGETGKMPIRTGVYVSQDDNNAGLQFAWTGNKEGRLIESSTFNDLGLQALRTVGRKDLWRNGDKMLAFVQANINDPLLREDSFFDDSQTPKLAPSLVAGAAFTSRPCKWYFVEMVNGEFEDIEEDAPQSEVPQNRLRMDGGQPCPQAGYWFTPAQSKSRRYFNQGEPMPVFQSNYGLTIWQWDEDQSN